MSKLTRYVLDTSAAANIVLDGEHAAWLVDRLDQAQRVIAPALFQSELANALWKQVRFAGLDPVLAVAKLENGIAFVDEFINEGHVMIHALQLAIRHQHPVYDMMFVATALQTGCQLLTLDRKLARLGAEIDANCVASVPSSVVH